MYRARLPLALQNEMLAFKKEESEGKFLKREKKKQEKKNAMEKEEEQEEEGKGGRVMKNQKGRGRKEKPVGTAAPGSRKRAKKEKKDEVGGKEEEREKAIVRGNGQALDTPVAVLEGMVKKEVKERKIMVMKKEVLEATTTALTEPSRTAAVTRSRGKEWE